MVIADTGFFLALANRRDRWHELATELLESGDEPLVTTWPVMTETTHLLLRRLGNGALLRFIDAYEQGAFQVQDIGDRAPGRLGALMRRYETLPMDLADASLVLLAEHLGHGRILSTDQRDFNAYRWKNRHPFENLMFLGPA